MESKQSFEARVHGFFEEPKGAVAVGFQVLMLFLILLSVLLLVFEEFYTQSANQYADIIDSLNKVILIAFTFEYFARVLTAPDTLRYVRQPMNVVDLMSFLPTYVEFMLHMGVNYTTTSLRVLRVVRFLRFARFIRGLRLLRFYRRLSGVFQYEGTILQAITPMILMVMAIKGLIWVLEYNGLWFTNSSLGELFAIIGFALGIILSQKIGVSYDKFTQVQESTVRIYANMQNLRLLLNGFRDGYGLKVCGEWTDVFLKVLEDPDSDNFSIHSHTDRLYQAIAEVDKANPNQFWSLHAQLCADASFCLSKKVRLTPKAYDLLLHQATIIYLMLIAFFIPGLTGMVSVLVATYILYGMYHLTRDLDSIFGGDYNLINIDISELKYFADECKRQANGSGIAQP